MVHHEDFGKLLRRLLTADKSLVEWADKLGTTQPQLSNLISGRRSMEINDAKRWSRALGLESQQKELFLRLAAVTHIPKEARHVFVELVYEIESLRRLVREMDA